MNEKTVEEKLIEAKILSENIKNQLPNIADPATVSIESKIPFKVLSIRELMIWRISDLSENAIKLMENYSIVCAIILIRASIECVALIHYLLKKVEKSIEEKTINDLDDNLMKLLLGERIPKASIQSINILKLIDYLNKDAPGVRQYYDNLSEFAHPNWSGSFGSYGNIDTKSMKLILGVLKDINSYPFVVALDSLIASIESFSLFYNELGDLFPEFSKICEKELKK